MINAVNMLAFIVLHYSFFKANNCLICHLVYNKLFLICQLCELSVPALQKQISKHHLISHKACRSSQVQSSLWGHSGETVIAANLIQDVFLLLGWRIPAPDGWAKQNAEKNVSLSSLVWTREDRGTAYGKRQVYCVWTGWQQWRRQQWTGEHVHVFQLDYLFIF